MAAVLDEAGTVGSAKHLRKWGPLLTCRSRMTDDLTVTVRLPDGAELPAGHPHLDTRLSALLGRRVVLSDTPPEHGGRLERAVPDHRGGIPDRLRATTFTDATGATITSGSTPPGSFFDYGTLHLVTTATLARLRSAYPAGGLRPSPLPPQPRHRHPGRAGLHRSRLDRYPPAHRRSPPAPSGAHTSMRGPHSRPRRPPARPPDHAHRREPAPHTRSRPRPALLRRRLPRRRGTRNSARRRRRDASGRPLTGHRHGSSSHRRTLTTASNRP